MDFKKHLEIAWNLTLKHIATLVLMALVATIVTCVTASILGPVVMAGFIQSVILMIRQGREPKIEDLFSQMRLLLPLLAFYVAVGIITIIGTFMLVLPGLAFSLAVAFGCLFMIPLMTDRQMGLLDAIKTSWRMVTDQNIADHIVVAILCVGLISVGSSTFIGVLFTLPFATVFLASIYLERMTTAPPPPPPATKTERL